MTHILTLGESLIRLSTDEGVLLSNAKRFNIAVGGAEANVAINLAQLDHTVSYATKLPALNPLTQHLKHQLDSFKINRKNILYEKGGRIGCYYLERGSSMRASKVLYDRKHSIISEMKKLEWDLDELFDGVELFHMTGITCAMSKAWQLMGVELVKAAKERGILVSFDMNFRQTMWSHEEARVVFEAILPHIDILSAGRLDAIHFMDVEDNPAENWLYYTEEMAKRYPNIQYIYGTNRQVLTPNSYRLEGFIWSTPLNQGACSKLYELESVVDRIGAGDSYAAAIIDGIVANKPLQAIVDFAMAASVLKHTIEGDVNLFNREDIENFMRNTSNVIR